MQNHMAEDIETFEVETPGFGLEAPSKTHFIWSGMQELGSFVGRACAPGDLRKL